MGDAALQRQNVGAVILDGFDRAFSLNVAHDLRVSTPQYKLTAALSGDQRSMSASGGGTQIAINIGRSGAGVIDSRNLLLSNRNARKAQMLAASVMTQLTPELKIAFGFRKGASGLTSRLQGVSAGGFFGSAIARL